MLELLICFGSYFTKVIPKVSVFTADEKSNIRKQVEESLNNMRDPDLSALLEFLNSKKAARESL